ncbi:DUF4219 domain-containing protein/UBN2 domain-containing protein [Cephalotus follicularis]|uniref:DUF4219 domain-containing protein/UBN2 domain-containing protein n=1 Tax=Cephalotus follicularis TaxID=3775 RepID=A0A1Q3BM84_CEPFO|nr:DUF4219 domain-containing protein/UBN2 domain-containing protein [Cephalotus follicularis]
MNFNSSESQNISKPPFFDGNNYSHWKAKMTIFIQSLDYNLWDIVMDGPNIPTTIVDCKGVPKLKNEYTIFDKKNLQLNARAMHVFYCALGPNEFNRIRSCISAKEIWDKLESTHEGTNQVKDSRIDMLIHEYELFEMRHYESIYYMFDRFTNIINSLNSLGKSFSNNELVRKILRSLPKSWQDKVTAIEEAKDLTKLKLEDLLGSLLTHELAMWRIEHGNEEMVVFKSLIKENSDEEEEEVSKEWENRYDFSSDDEEVTNFCMMVIEEGLNNEVYKFSHTYNEPYKFVIDFKYKWLNPD